jgi:hypothetical protein
MRKDNPVQNFLGQALPLKYVATAVWVTIPGSRLEKYKECELLIEAV